MNKQEKIRNFLFRKIIDFPKRYSYQSSSIPLLALCLFLIQGLKAQEKNSFVDQFNINLELKNMHTWHGSIVTPGMMAASSLEYESLNKKFIAGIWGGANFTGDYKEFSYYTTYRFTDKLNISLISHNNYSNIEDVNILSYDKYKSPNFVDIVLTYTVSENIPIKFYWSTILFGNGGDFTMNTDGTVTDSYSNYAELSYTFIFQKKTSLSLFAGGAFSLVTKKTFYSEHTNFTNIGVKMNRDIALFSQHIPVAAKAFINPETKRGALQVSLTIV